MDNWTCILEDGLAAKKLLPNTVFIHYDQGQAIGEPYELSETEALGSVTAHSSVSYKQ